MAGEWLDMPFSQAVMLNPRIQLTRSAAVAAARHEQQTHGAGRVAAKQEGIGYGG